MQSNRTDAAEQLLQDLNELLASLSLPLTVTTPYDLTPSFLLAILESILRARLPISDATRESQTAGAKVEIMKIFLGVLEDDVLCVDIGLSEIDPRRLAAGEWDDLVFVGKVLCWVARNRTHSARSRLHSAPDGHAESSSTGSNGNTNCTPFSQIDVSRSSATTEPRETNLYPAPRDPSAFLPRRAPVHQSEQSVFSEPMSTASLETFDVFCDCSKQTANQAASSSLPGGEKEAAWLDRPSTPPGVRYEGLIDFAHDDVPAFESRRHVSFRRTEHPIHRGSTLRISSASPHYTRHLLRERTRLLEELAMMKVKTPEQLHGFNIPHE